MGKIYVLKFCLYKINIKFANLILTNYYDQN